MEELHEMQQCEGVSLGIIRPYKIYDLKINEETERDWKPEWKTLLSQLRLFGPQQKPLEKIPFSFSYHFVCDDSRCKGHTMMIADWEVGQLFLAMRDKYQDERIAAEKVKDKFFKQMCASDIDTHFFVGTTLQYGTWIVLGVFWPRK